MTTTTTAMQFTATVNRKRFTAALTTASKATAPKSPKEVLRYVRLTVSQSGILTLEASDCEQAASINYANTSAKDGLGVLGSTRITGAGSILINPKQLLARLKISKATDCVLSYHAETGLTLDGAGCSECLSTIEACEHPGYSCPDKPISHGVVLSVEFIRLLGACEANTDLYSTRYALGSVLVELHTDGVILVATDGRRMLWGNLGDASATHSQPIASGLLPCLAINGVVALAKLADRVAITVFDNHLRFEALDATDNVVGEVCSRLVEGRFPRWREVIPVQDNSVSFLASDLLNAAKTCKGAIPALTPAEKKAGDLEQAGMLLTVTDSHVQWDSKAVKGCGAQWERNDNTDYAGRFTVELDCRFLADFATKCAKHETITMVFVNGNKPVTFRTDWCTQLIMPMCDK